MNYRILTTEAFERDIKRLVKKYRTIKDDVGDLLDELEKDPFKAIPSAKVVIKSGWP